jgi:Membrane-associated lipoprotein involved in thiamine biosynthesis
MKIYKQFLGVLLLAVLAACTPGINEDAATLYRLDMTFDGYLNTATIVTVYHPAEFDADRLKAQVEQFLQEANVIYSAYSEGSEMYQVNLRASDEVVSISPELTKAIRVSLEYAKLSNGLYDPTVLPLVLLWNIDGSSWFTGGNVPTQAQIDAVLPLIDYRQVLLDEANQTVTYLTPGMQLDLGGFSKGYVTYQIYELLLAEGIEHALINIGSSSQMTIGTRVTPLNNTEGVPRFIPQTEEWRIGTKDPFDPIGIAPAIGSFGLSNKALSSSGSSQQYFEVDGRRYHHLFDPATGYPIDNELIVVQVVSEDPVGIDSLSTLVYLLGLEEGIALVESLAGVEAIFITYDKEIFHTSGFASFNLFDTTYRIGQKH